MTVEYILNLLAHGATEAELAQRRRPERVFHPAIGASERAARLAAWQRSLNAVRRFYNR